MTAGRVFRISPAKEGSKATHHTSPRRGGSAALIRGVADHALAPLQRLRLAPFVRRHGAISGIEPRRGDMRPREIVDEAADAAAPHHGVQPIVDVGVNRDCQLLLHESLYTYDIRLAGVDATGTGAGASPAFAGQRPSWLHSAAHV